MKSGPPHPDTLWASLGKLRQLLTRREKIGFLLLLGVMIGGALLETVSIGAVPMFVSVAIDPAQALANETVAPLLSTLNITTQRALILWGGAALIVVFLLKTIYMFLQTYFQIRYTQNRQLHLTNRLFKAYMHAPYEFHLNRNTSELLRNTQLEVESIVYRVLAPLLSLAMYGFEMLALVALLLATEPVIALISLVVFGLAGGGYELALKRRLKLQGLQAQQYRNRVLQAIQQGLGVLKEARVLRREAYFTHALRQSLQKIMLANRFSNLANRMTAPYMEFLAVAGLLGVAMGLVALGRDMATIAPTLTLFAAVFVRLKSGLTTIVSSFTGLRFNLVSIDPVYEDLRYLSQSRQRSPDGTSQSLPLHLEHEIRLRGVGYSYPGAANETLKDINLTIARGEAVAFVGPTGAGKTTIVDVILGLLEPQCGEILADGRNIYDDLAAWQRAVGYIPQFIYLTDDTIRHNVALGLEDDDIDDVQVWQALRAAQLQDFVNTLPDGLDTTVGERGIRLSGGQRQRVGIARALYHNPDILIMDEATSALDDATEREVISAVNALKGERTIVMIAHRLTTVQGCDRLFSMRDGKIETAGSYAELIQDHHSLGATAG